MHQLGRPVLVGTTSVERSEFLAGLLEKEKIPYQFSAGLLEREIPYQHATYMRVYTAGVRQLLTFLSTWISCELGEYFVGSEMRSTILFTHISATYVGQVLDLHLLV
eukprot:1182084-Prorocentrum_minimum.AAC.1